MLTYYWQ